MICDQAGVSPCAPKERFTVPLLGTGKALGIAATSGAERVANASEMRLTPNPRWYAVHIGNNPFPCPCGVISEHSVCATPLQFRWAGNTRSRQANRLCSVAVISTVCACADHWRGRFDADIASQARARVEENFAVVTFASTKILVQTQWEAVRFDRVKHTAGTLLEVFFAAVEAGSARCLAPSLSVAPSHSGQQRTEEAGRPR